MYSSGHVTYLFKNFYWFSGVSDTQILCPGTLGFSGHVLFCGLADIQLLWIAVPDLPWRVSPSISLVHMVWAWLTPPAPIPGMGTYPRSKPFRASCSGPQKLVPGWAWNPTTVIKKTFRDFLGGPEVKTALALQGVQVRSLVKD